MSDSLYTALTSASSSYLDALKKMGASLTRLSTGKRFQTAAEDIGAYLKVNSIRSSRTLFESAQASVKEAKAFLDVADAYATSLIDDLTDLKTEAYNIENTSGAEQDAAIARFDNLRESISDTLATSYNGVGLNITANTTFQTVRLGNGGSIGLDFALVDDAVDYDNTEWDTNYATTAGNIDDEIDQIASFAGKVSGYQAAVDAQSTFLETMIANMTAAESTITSINEAAEIATYVAEDVRQQSALYMISQANSSRRAILNLFQ